MKKFLLVPLCMLAFLAFFLPAKVSAQGNIDWDVIWERYPPPLQPDTVFNYFMRNAKQYTGLAYDKFRDVIYITSPQQCVAGTIWWNCPRIYVWDAWNGTPALGVGRSADPNRAGKGGEIPVPNDTLGSKRFQGFSQGRYPIFKIRVDDEGRIFACNLVAPVWGVCVDLDGDGNCDGSPQVAELDWKAQGPYRVWRWDTPKSTPLLAYETLDPSGTRVGTDINDSEMPWTRFGDAFDVLGKRCMYDPGNGQQPYLRDSVRIYTSGGSWLNQPEWNREVNVIIGDFRPVANRPVTDFKSNPFSPYNTLNEYPLTHRLGVRLVNSNMGLACHGVAATGLADNEEVWMDSNDRVTTAAQQVFYADDPAHPYPQIFNQNATGNRALSSLVTGESGTIRYFALPQYGRKFLICAGGPPTGGTGSGQPNLNTVARLIDVTTPGSEFIVFGDTPYLGQNELANMSASNNWCSAVDYGFFTDTMGLHVVLWVLMTNNGIGCYISRRVIPVELTTLRGILDGDHVQLTWNITSETNNYGFEVQRSFDNGNNWEVAGFVPGRGTTRDPYQYSYADPVTLVHKNTGMVKYRLRQLDNDGKFSYSPTVNVYIGSTPSTIELMQNYPNPFNPSTTIGYQLSKPGFVTLKVFNALGEEAGTLVNESKEAGTYQVQMSSEKLPSGTYMYQLNVDGNILQKKMVVMK